MSHDHIPQEGEWVWVRTGEKLDYNNWCRHYHEPNGGRYENYLEMFGTHKEEWIGQWNDIVNLAGNVESRPLCQYF